jgi:hypothetical protein
METLPRCIRPSIVPAICITNWYTILTSLPPPPLDDTPEALQARNHAAIARVAALLPVNANEADLAPSFACSVAQCIAARARAEETLRLLRQSADNIGRVMRLNAQDGSMVRTSLSMHGRLMQPQALRRKREAIDATANVDAWAEHSAERSTLRVVDPDAAPREVASPEEAPAAVVDPRNEQHFLADGTNSQDVAFETLVSAQIQGWGSEQPDSSRQYEVVWEAMPGLRSTGRELPANGRQSFLMRRPSAMPPRLRLRAPSRCQVRTLIRSAYSWAGPQRAPGTRRVAMKSSNVSPRMEA